MNHSLLGKDILALSKRLANQYKSKLVPDSLFIYSELVALGTVLGRVVNSDSLGRWESSQQNYLLLAKKGVGKNAVIDASDERLKELLALKGLPASPRTIHETTTPEALAKAVGYWRTFNPETTAEKYLKDNPAANQSEIDSHVDQARSDWEQSAYEHTKTKRCTEVWFSVEASTVLATLIGGARSEQEIGSKIGWALTAFDPKGKLDSLRVTSGERYVRNVCISNLWATQPQTFFRTFDLEQLRYSGMFERMVPVCSMSEFADPTYDIGRTQALDEKIALLHQNNGRVSVTFDDIPSNLEELIAWERSLPAVKECLRFDEEQTSAGLSKWFAHARRIAHLRAFLEKVTETDIRSLSGFDQTIEVDASEFLGDALEWVAGHYLAMMREEELSTRDDSYSKFLRLLCRWYDRYESDEPDEREQARSLMHVNYENGQALFRTRQIADRLRLPGMDRSGVMRQIQSWANTQDIRLDDCNPNPDKWRRKAGFIIISLERIAPNRTLTTSLQGETT